MSKQTPNGDPILFYALGVSAFLEATTPVYVDSLSRIFAHDAATVRWLETTWQPEEERHGAWMRDYLCDTYPEMDWPRAYADFLESYRPLCAVEELRPTAALEALSRCVTETQACMAYRCLAAHSGESRLVALLGRMSRDEAEHYRVFRDLFEQENRRSGHGFWRLAWLVVWRSRLVRDEDVAHAVAAIARHVPAGSPLPVLTPVRFQARMAAVLKAHFPFEAGRRMLTRPLQPRTPLQRAALALVTWAVRRQFGAVGSSSVATPAAC